MPLVPSPQHTASALSQSSPTSSSSCGSFSPLSKSLSPLPSVGRSSQYHTVRPTRGHVEIGTSMCIQPSSLSPDWPIGTCMSFRSLTPSSPSCLLHGASKLKVWTKTAPSGPTQMLVSCWQSPSGEYSHNECHCVTASHSVVSLDISSGTHSSPSFTFPRLGLWSTASCLMYFSVMCLADVFTRCGLPHHFRAWDCK